VFWQAGTRLELKKDKPTYGNASADKTQADPLMGRAYLNERATGGAVESLANDWREVWRVVRNPPYEGGSGGWKNPSWQGGGGGKNLKLIFLNEKFYEANND
jgi:hypothetical protein